jgi:predicted RNA-binding Zn ribbon-like protein
MGVDGETQRPSVQPGGRAPAPGELALVQSFINTHYDLEVEHGAELFATPASVERWFRQRGLLDGAARVDAHAQQRVLVAREALRSLTHGDGDRTALDGDRTALDAINGAARGAAVEVRFQTPSAARFVPAAGAGVGGALGLVLAIAAQAMGDGSWARLKVCPGEDCGWVFYDHSRNQTGRWCSMSVCGGRAKARSHYRRQRGEARP